ncbi:MAG: hypothetical protein KDD64_06325 [Bdellovibrionales bacterium]|nr:hypothetical protein [Bdellovibrionales bacterium]
MKNERVGKEYSRLMKEYYEFLKSRPEKLSELATGEFIRELERLTEKKIPRTCRVKKHSHKYKKAA